MIKISFITPLYNGNKYLSGLINCWESNYKNLKKIAPDAYVEAILVNDYPDQKIDMSMIYKANLSKITVIENKINEGIHKSRMNGFQKAEGDYVCFLDQDDFLSNRFLSHMMSGCKDEADLIVCNGYRRKLDRKSSLYKTNLALMLVRKKNAFIYGTDMILSPGQCLIRRNRIPEQWKSNILYPNGCDDFYLWLCMYTKRLKVLCVNEKLYCHNEDCQNYSGSKEKMTASFESMVRLLKNKGILNKKEIKILEARLKIKKSKGIGGIMLILFKHPPILFWTLLYKILGYD